MKTADDAFDDWAADKPRFAAGGFDATIARRGFLAGVEWARKEAAAARAIERSLTGGSLR